MNVSVMWDTSTTIGLNDYRRLTLMAMLRFSIQIGILKLSTSRILKGYTNENFYLTKILLGTVLINYDSNSIKYTV